MLNRTIAKIFAIVLQYNSTLRIILWQNVKKKNIYIYIYIYILFTPFLFSFLFSLFLLFSVSPSLLSPLYGPKRHLFSLFLLWLWFLAVMVVVFGCDRSLKGVVGCGWVRCGLWVVGRRGCGSVVVVDRHGCGLWVVDRHGCGLWIGVVGSWSWIGELG